MLKWFLKWFLSLSLQMEMNRKMNGIKKRMNHHIAKSSVCIIIGGPYDHTVCPVKNMNVININKMGCNDSSDSVAWLLFSFFWKRVFVWGWEQVLRRAEKEKKKKKKEEKLLTATTTTKKILLACCTVPGFNLSPPGSLSTQQGAKTCSDQVEVQSASFISVLQLKKKKKKGLLLLSWQIIWFWSCMAWRKCFQTFCRKLH